MPWSTSDRRERLPHNWPELKRKVKARAGGKCEADRHERSCDGTGTDCDHVVQGDNHSLTNLQWLSGPCHQAKTARESAARNHQRAALKRRPAEQHPGRRS
jgi:5-methylcytosine-specific restriction endonuclease McrA